MQPKKKVARKYKRRQLQLLKAYMRVWKRRLRNRDYV